MRKHILILSYLLTLIAGAGIFLWSCDSLVIGKNNDGNIDIVDLLGGGPEGQRLAKKQQELKNMIVNEKANQAGSPRIIPNDSPFHPNNFDVAVFAVSGPNYGGGTAKDLSLHYTELTPLQTLDFYTYSYVNFTKEKVHYEESGKFKFENTYNKNRLVAFNQYERIGSTGSDYKLIFERSFFYDQKGLLFMILDKEAGTHQEGFIYIDYYSNGNKRATVTTNSSYKKRITHYNYNLKGEVIKKIEDITSLLGQEPPRTITYEYENGRVSSYINSYGNYDTYKIVYSDEFKTRAITSQKDQRTLTSYLEDISGKPNYKRLFKITNNDPSVSWDERNYFYDDRSNLVKIEGKKNNVVIYTQTFDF